MRALLAVVLAAACSKDAPVDKTAAAKAHENAHATLAAPRPRPAKLAKVTIKALGMYCEESCPLRVRMALAELPVVYELGFDTSTERIFVSYDSARGAPKVAMQPVIEAVRLAGFDPWLARESWPTDAHTDVVPRPR